MKKRTTTTFIQRLFLFSMTLAWVLLPSMGLQGQACNCEEYLYINEPEDDPSPHGLATDLNGNIYVGESIATDGSADIRRLTCDGEIVPESEFVIEGFPHFNSASTGNLMIANRRDGANIDIFDLCEQGKIGEVCFLNPNNGNQVGPAWGLTEAEEGVFYALSFNRLYRFTVADTVDCLDPICSLPAPEYGNYSGLTFDSDGFLYIVDGTLTINGNVKKFDLSTCMMVAESVFDDDESNGGAYHPVGITYSEGCDCIYTSNNTSIADCVSRFDTDLTYLEPAIGPQDSADPLVGKAIGITVECCPTMDFTVEESLCFMGMDTSLFLQEYVGCDGVVCEGTWLETADPNNVFSLDPCDNSVAVTGVGCATYTLSLPAWAARLIPYPKGHKPAISNVRPLPSP